MFRQYKFSEVLIDLDHMFALVKRHMIKWLDEQRRILAEPMRKPPDAYVCAPVISPPPSRNVRAHGRKRNGVVRPLVFRSVTYATLGGHLEAWELRQMAHDAVLERLAA